MGESAWLLKGVFNDGVIVPEPGMVFGDGTTVEFRALSATFTLE